LLTRGEPVIPPVLGKLSNTDYMATVTDPRHQIRGKRFKIKFSNTHPFSIREVAATLAQWHWDLMMD